MKSDDFEKGNEYIGCFKVLVSQTSAEHAGEPSKDGKYRVLTSSMKVIGISDICTHSYILVGQFDNEKEANNTFKYLQTKFVRFLMLLALTSIHISKNTFQFVPIQNFTDNSDIDWNKTIPEIDKQLYEKYNLSEDEIAFIEEKIKPME